MQHGQADTLNKPLLRTSIPLQDPDLVCGPNQQLHCRAPCASAVVEIICDEPGILPAVKTDLARLYQHMYASAEKIQFLDGVNEAGAYIVRMRDEVVTLFLFRRTGTRVRVLNEFFTSDEDELNRFSAAMFARFPTLTCIEFGPVNTDNAALTFAHHHVNCNEDIVLELPATVQEYTLRLGGATRQNLKQSRNRLKRDFPSFTFTVHDGSAIDEAQFRAVIELSRARMSDKAKNHSFDEQEVQALYRLAREIGTLGVATIDGRVCAGTICYRVDSHFFLEVIAHDSAFNAYGLGTYTCYLMIGEAIARRFTHYHFLWGREEYKFRLGGERQDFDSLSIYRSRWHYLTDIHQVTRKTWRGCMRQARLWLVDPARRSNPLVKCLINSTRWLRRAWVTPDKGRNSPTAPAIR